METPKTENVASVASTSLVLPSFERVRVTITENAWKGEKGWITGPKNEVDANPITTDGGIHLAWFDSEIHRENAEPSHR